MQNIISYRVGYADKPQLPLERVAKVGITHLELVVRPEEQSAADIKELLSPTGLRAASVTVPCPISEEAVFKVFETYSRLAKELGARVLFTSVHAGETAVEVVYDRMRRIGDIAQANGLVVAMETHPDLCENGDKQVATMTSINHPAIGVNFDTANIYYYNKNVDTVEELKKSKAFVKSVHLKDTLGGFHDPNFPVLGEGVVDFKSVFEVLNAVGFFGPFTLELEGPKVHADSPEEMEKHVLRCVEHLRSLGVLG